MQGAKVGTSISAIQSGMQQQPAIPTTTTTNQFRISTDAIGVHDAAIIATCVRAGPAWKKLCALTQVAMIAAIALMLVLTFAPCTLTFGTNTPLMHVVVSPTATLVVLFNSATGGNTLLANVVVSPSATNTGCVFPSTCWCRYCTCTRATCTVWWWSRSVVVVVVVCVCGGGSCSHKYIGSG